jgi:glycerol dehydrogenase-like iron-containing ADH family enzyme
MLLLVPLTILAAGCGDVLDRVDELRGGAEQVTDRARFCLAVTRAVAAVEANAPDTAAEAAEEALATAPEDIDDAARALVDAVRAADGDPFRDDDVTRAAERLEDRTRELCDPLGG